MPDSSSAPIPSVSAAQRFFVVSGVVAVAVLFATFVTLRGLGWCSPAQAFAWAALAVVGCAATYGVLRFSAHVVTPIGIGVVCSVVILVWRSLEVLVQASFGATPATFAWVLGVAAFAWLLATRSASSEPIAGRAGGWAAAMDAVFSSLAWTAGVWRLMLGGGATETLGAVPWLTLLTLFTWYVVLFATSVRTTWTTNTTLLLGLIGGSLFSIMETLLYQGNVGRVSSTETLWAPLVLAIGWLFFAVAGLAWMHQRSVPWISAETDDAAGLSNANAATGVLLSVLSLAQYPIIDPGTLVCFGLLAIVYALREWASSIRKRHTMRHYRTLSVTDGLTGLWSRRRLKFDLVRRQGPGKCLGLVAIDLDDFAAINESLGHAGGDEALTSYAQALGRVADAYSASAYRIGGNEFALLLEGNTTECVSAAHEAVRVASTDVRVRDTAIACSARAGVAWNIQLGEVANRDDLLTNAVEALRVAKGTTTAVQPYTVEISQQLTRRMGVEQALPAALAQGHVTFHYQPIVDLATYEVLGVESLARWEDPELGLVSPVEFIPIAERTGAIHEIGRQAVDAAIDMLNAMAPFAPNLYASVNVSPSQLRRPDFVASLVERAGTDGVDPSRVTLEVTENIFIDAGSPAVAAVEELVGAGYAVALDDFGQGYSALGYMTRMPFSTVKLDRSLTINLDKPTIRAVVAALASSDVHVVAEGVEDEETAARLRDLRVGRGQGWLWCKAVPQAELPAQVERLRAHSVLREV